jgi:hypothetical protein
MESSDRYQLAAQKLILDFLEENGLLTAHVIHMVKNRDAVALSNWAATVKNQRVKVALDVFIGGMQVSENLKKLNGMVEDLTDRARFLQEQLNGNKEEGSFDEVDWSKVEGWH